MLAHERDDLLRLGQEAVVGVGHDDPRPGDAELRGDTVLEILSTAQRRQPHDARPEAERDLDGRRIHAAHLSVAADSTEHRYRGAGVALHRPGEGGGRCVMRLQDDGAMTRGRGLAGRLERVDGTLAVGVGPEVTMQIGRAGEIDAHGGGAYA